MHIGVGVMACMTIVWEMLTIVVYNALWSDSFK